MARRWQKLIDQGTSAMERHNFADAIERFTCALSIAEKTADALDRFQTLTALGAAYGANQQPDLAEEVYSRALALCAISAELGRYPVAGCLISLANVYKDLGKSDDSRAAALKSIELLTGDTTGDPTAMLIPLTLLVELSLQVSNYELATFYLDKAVKLFSQHRTANASIFKDKLVKQIEQMPATVRNRFELGMPAPSARATYANATK
jgi:tetratricopeptide (TPR) repeat protein